MMRIRVGRGDKTHIAKITDKGSYKNFNTICGYFGMLGVDGFYSGETDNTCLKCESKTNQEKH